MFGRLRFILATVAANVTAASSAIVDLPIQVRNSWAAVHAEIGTPPSTFVLYFDTGSSTSWVDNETCAATCLNGSGYARTGYNVSASSTGVLLGAVDEIDYLSGEISGPAVADLFTVDSEDGTTLTWNQTFLAVGQSPFSALAADGFLGLAFSSIAEPETKTLVETLIEEGLLDEPRFGIYYGKYLNDSGNTPDGLMTLGGSREEIYAEGDLTYVPLKNESEYEVWRSSILSITGTKSAQGNLSQSTAQTFNGGLAVFDTGTADIQVPSSLLIPLYESVGFNYTAILHGEYIPQCTDFNSSWSVSFTFGDSTNSQTITISGDQLQTPGFAYSLLACFPPFSDSGFDDFVLVGASVLANFYTVWDFGATTVSEYKPRVGFGKLKDEYKPCVA